MSLSHGNPLRRPIPHGEYVSRWPSPECRLVGSDPHKHVRMSTMASSQMICRKRTGTRQPDLPNTSLGQAICLRCTDTQLMPYRYPTLIPILGNLVPKPSISQPKPESCSSRLRAGVPVPHPVCYRKVAYAEDAKDLWDDLKDELDDYSRMQARTCAAAQDSVKKKEIEKLYQFLRGLNVEIFGTIRSQILNLDPLPTLRKAFSMVTQDER
uniref:Uncharacterized protein n=1 Tax=Ananas comosus var. bracteatus TaxID=296719 RepID=A0A6V7PV18_ANACO|nr:unnamed protein product [Ananas comosus var. bracteatus]